METRASHIAVGAFVLVLLFGALGFIVWVSHFSERVIESHFFTRFSGSVAGLDVSSNVLFGGIPVGHVTSVEVDPAGFLPRPCRSPGRGHTPDPHRFRGDPGDAGHHRRGAGGDQPRHQDRPKVENRLRDPLGLFAPRAPAERRARGHQQGQCAARPRLDLPQPAEFDGLRRDPRQSGPSDRDLAHGSGKFDGLLGTPTPRSSR